MRHVLLDLLRVIAVSVVVLVHTGFLRYGPAFLNSSNVLPYLGYQFVLGELAVTLFLILSGLGLALNYGSIKISFRAFIKKRFLRIYPIYFFAVVFAIAITLFSVFVRNIAYETIMPVPCVYCNIPEIICNFTASCVFIGKYHTFVSYGWFITLIMILYFLFPFISNAMKKRPVPTIFSLLIISVVSKILILQYEDLLVLKPTTLFVLRWFPLSRLFEFGIGVFLAYAVRSSFWGVFDKFKKAGLILAYFAELSFPLFLIHLPVFRLMRLLFGHEPGLQMLFGIFISLCLSRLILRLARKLVPARYARFFLIEKKI